jgi:hypothetical protein
MHPRMQKVQSMRPTHEAVARITKFLPLVFYAPSAWGRIWTSKLTEKTWNFKAHTSIAIVTVRSNYELTFQMLTLGATGPTWIWVGSSDLAWHVNNQRAHVNITIEIGLRAQPMFPHTARTMNQREARTLSLSIHWMEEKTLSEGPACNNWNILGTQFTPLELDDQFFWQLWYLWN